MAMARSASMEVHKSVMASSSSSSSPVVSVVPSLNGMRRSPSMDAASSSVATAVTATSDVDYTFEVSVVPKSAGHPQHGRGSQMCYAINNQQGATVTMERGARYRFKLFCRGFPFYLTTSSVGGLDVSPKDQRFLGNSPPADYGVIEFRADDTVPSSFYYQCRVNTHMGGVINVVEPASSSSSHGANRRQQQQQQQQQQQPAPVQRKHGVSRPAQKQPLIRSNSSSSSSNGASSPSGSASPVVSRLRLPAQQALVQSEQQQQQRTTSSTNIASPRTRLSMSDQHRHRSLDAAEFARAAASFSSISQISPTASAGDVAATAAMPSSSSHNVPQQSPRMPSVAVDSALMFTVNGVPTAARFAPGDDEVMHVALKHGLVVRVDVRTSRSVGAVPFLDVTADIARQDGKPGSPRSAALAAVDCGLVGLEFHPSFNEPADPDNCGRFFVFYSSATSSSPRVAAAVVDDSAARDEGEEDDDDVMTEHMESMRSKAAVVSADSAASVSTGFQRLAMTSRSANNELDVVHEVDLNYDECKNQESGAGYDYEDDDLDYEIVHINGAARPRATFDADALGSRQHRPRQQHHASLQSTRARQTQSMDSVGELYAQLNGGGGGVVSMSTTATPAQVADERRVPVTHRDRVAEFRVRHDTATVDARSERVLLTIERRSRINTGGAMAFGPDGMLYVAVGDGGPSNDVYDHAQNPRCLQGKILRLDVTTPLEHFRLHEYVVPRGQPLTFRDDMIEVAPGVRASYEDAQVTALAPVYCVGVRRPSGLFWDLPVQQQQHQQQQQQQHQNSTSPALNVCDQGAMHRNWVCRARLGDNCGWRVKEGEFVASRARHQVMTSPMYGTRFAGVAFEYERPASGGTSGAVGGCALTASDVYAHLPVTPHARPEAAAAASANSTDRYYIIGDASGTVSLLRANRKRDNNGNSGIRFKQSLHGGGGNNNNSNDDFQYEVLYTHELPPFTPDGATRLCGFCTNSSRSQIYALCYNEVDGRGAVFKIFFA